MKYNKVIYTILSTTDTLIPFPYPPLYLEPFTDYLCFTNRSGLQSDFWEIIYTDDFSVIPTILSNYKDIFAIKSNEICIHPLSSEKFTITLPDFVSLYHINFSLENLIPSSDENGNWKFSPNPVYTSGKYHGRSYQLTIGIPVSNQISTIHKCLQHLQDLRNAIDCELLIINTGSSDGTIEAAMQYGARVIDFPWCNNMSAARNMGIYHALGEWYLSLDDDEWFESTNSIIHFFQNGIYKQYDYAAYIQRNYTRNDGLQFHDHYTVRMGRITPSLHFEGRIHDAMCFPRLTKVYYHTDYVHHYGFCHDDIKKVEEKSKRNLSLLLYDYYEYPLCIRYILQIANELATYHPDAAVAWFYLGLSTCKLLNDSTYESQLLTSHLLLALYRMESEDLYPLSESYLKDKELSIADLACIHFCRFDLAAHLEYDTKFILSEAKAYHSLCDTFLSNPSKYQRFSLLSLDVCRSPIYKSVYYINLFVISIREQDYQSANNYLPFIQLDIVSYPTIQRFFRALLQAPSSLLSKGCQKLSLDNIPIFFEEVLNYALSIPDILTSLPFELLPSDSPYTKLLRLFANQESIELYEYFNNLSVSLLELLSFLNDKLYYFAFQKYMTLYRNFIKSQYHYNIINETHLSILPIAERIVFYYQYISEHILSPECEPFKQLKALVVQLPVFQRGISLSFHFSDSI